MRCEHDARARHNAGSELEERPVVHGALGEKLTSVDKTVLGSIGLRVANVKVNECIKRCVADGPLKRVENVAFHLQKHGLFVYSAAHGHELR